MATYPTNTKLKIETADSKRLVLRFILETRGGDADPFHQWLNDDKPVGIDWCTFGIEKLHSEPPLE